MEGAVLLSPFLEKKMETIKVNFENRIDMDAINRGAEIIKKGGDVAFPTETVYVLGADALNK